MKPYQTLIWIAFFSLFLMMDRSFAQQSSDIRKVRWGFTPKQVREAENTKPTSVKRDKLIYNRVPLADRTVGLEYEFTGDSLLSASYYYYTTASVTKDDVVAASIDFESRLKEKYGLGKASIVGDIRTTVWLTPRTQISLAVGNVDKGWSLEVVYLCRICTLDKATAGTPATAEFKPLKDVQDF